MITEYFIHLAHKTKFFLRSKDPFAGRGFFLRLADKIVGEPTKPIVIKTLYGFKLAIDPIRDKGVERSIFYTGTYEAGTLDIFDKILRKGDCFIDVGSNIGLMAIFAANKIGKNGVVHSFEPEPDTFSILEKNCRINNIQNIHLNNIALGNDIKEGVIYSNFEINRGASSLIRQGTTPGKKINITTLDNYLELQGISNVKLIKIDIEGYEFEMLKGAALLLKKANAPIICVEYSKHVEQIGILEDVYNFIKKVNNYRIFKFESWKGDVCKLVEVESENEMPDHDNVFCFLPSQLSEVTTDIFKY